MQKRGAALASVTQNHELQTLHDSFAKIELLKFASMVECEVDIVTKTFRTIIRDQFRNEVDLQTNNRLINNYII